MEISPCGRLAAEATRPLELASELATALAPIRTNVDGQGQAAEVEPPTSWEDDLDRALGQLRSS
ncbi:hypothetical protein [Nonomuraea dietziae]|uniref:hypothetical protein n=1 Tax=Nonomuraea dietziae TaxID=65515 RepID=UPI00341E350E